MGKRNKTEEQFYNEIDNIISDMLGYKFAGSVALFKDHLNNLNVKQKDELLVWFYAFLNGQAWSEEYGDICEFANRHNPRKKKKWKLKLVS
jgi:hypothetical protein